jgi:hypothetical protein
MSSSQEYHHSSTVSAYIEALIRPAPASPVWTIPARPRGEVPQDGAPWYWDDLGAMTAPVRCRAIKHRIADRYSVSVADLEGPRHTRRIFQARAEAVAAVYAANPGWGLARIGEQFGGRHHTTILNIVYKFGTHREKRTAPLSPSAKNTLQRERLAALKQDPAAYRAFRDAINARKRAFLAAKRRQS